MRRARFAAFAADTLLAGLFVDEWMESIPAHEETTGLGFHFDAPGARPPQAHPASRCRPIRRRRTGPLDGLLGVVNEAMLWRASARRAAAGPAGSA